MITGCKKEEPEKCVLTESNYQFKLSEDESHYIFIGLANVNNVIKIEIPSEYNGLPVVEIGSYAFDCCASLTSITIPNSVTSIGSYAFYSCDSLTSIIIPNSVTSIGEYAFRYCSSLTIYCEATSEPSGWNSRWNYSDYSNRPVYWGVTKKDIIDQNEIQYLIIDGNATITRYIGNDTIVDIPKTIRVNGKKYNVTCIGSDAFSDCSSLTSITIPNSVTSIGERAFYKCSSLTSITIPFVGNTLNGTSNTHFGYIFGASSYNYNLSYVPTSLKEVIITGGTSIGVRAFYYCSSLTSITIPNSVTSIGMFAFSNCSRLTIYCEATSKPSGWDSNWNPSNRPVYWG